MRAEDRFRRSYPDCSRREIRDLVEAIKGDKYWRVDPKVRDVIYVVALTRARYPEGGAFRARATHVKSVLVDPRAARYCRKGRVLIVVNGYARHVLTWPAFLRLMKMDSERVLKAIFDGTLPPFTNSKILGAIKGKLG